MLFSLESVAQLDPKLNSIDVKTKAKIDLIESRTTATKIRPANFVPNVTYTNDTITQAKTATSYTYLGKVVYKQAFAGALPNTNTEGTTTVKTGIGKLLSVSGWLKCHGLDADGNPVYQTLYNPIHKYSSGTLQARHIFMPNVTTYNSRFFIIIYFTEP